ncbi:MAG: hypothetical protein JXR48_07805 [Candidatus Delongbacteria bacterium]|nr:hypothetical protein [Candidatus Delongbacteria bacterium]
MSSSVIEDISLLLALFWEKKNLPEPYFKIKTRSPSEFQPRGWWSWFNFSVLRKVECDANDITVLMGIGFG